jgi:hypothetical protein
MIKFKFMSIEVWFKVLIVLLVSYAYEFKFRQVVQVI